MEATARFWRFGATNECSSLFFSMFLEDADASEIKVQVCVYAFDLLYLNGKVGKRPWHFVTNVLP